MPNCKSLDEYLDTILPKVKKYGENANELGFLDTRWLEIRDEDSYHETVLHVFTQSGDYLIINDGNITNGKWGQMIDGFQIAHGIENQFFEGVFLNEDFFILRKHGRQKGKSKYRCYAREESVRGLDWRNVMELLFNIYRANSQFSIYLFGALILIVIIVVYSLL